MSPRQLSVKCVLFTQSTVSQGRETLMKPALQVVAPAIVNRTVAPRRRPNAELRTREYLTETEVEKLIEAARTTVRATATPR